MIILKSRAKHESQVSEIQDVISKRKSTITLTKTTSNTLREGAYKKNKTQVSFKKLNSVLEIDEKNLYALVEPRMQVADLCRVTLKYGLVPLVVPEFTSITVGGAVMGVALESSSFKQGQFNDTCDEYELVLGDGSLITASREKNSDLFFALPGSFGTIALLTLVKIRLTQALPYVALTYTRFSQIDSILDFFKTKRDCDFLDGISFSKNEFVAISGVMSEEKQGPLISQKRYFSKWFYHHMRDTKNTQECMRIEEYLFRLDRGAFWMGNFLLSPLLVLRALLQIGVKKMAPKMREGQKKTPLFAFRLIFGGIFSSKFLYKLWHKIPKTILEEIFFVHDFYAPFAKAGEIFNLFTEKTGIFPVWFCPLRSAKDLYVNIGLYGMPATSAKALSIDLEKEIVKREGRKMLYSFTYYAKKEFIKLYESESYESVRNKYHGNAFPELADKVL